MKVLSKRCDQCLFSSAKIVSDKRKLQLLTDIRNEQGYFVCHKASHVHKDVMCRGFYDDRGGESQMLRIAERLNVVVFIEEENL